MRNTHLVLVLSVLLTAPWLSHPFFSRGEPREALTAQAILRTGDWILPARYGDEVATKPPLTHWLMSIASLPDGEVTEFTARAPSALFSIITVLVLFLFLRSRIGERSALFSSLTLLTMFEWHRSATGARVDLVLSALIAIGLLAFFDYYQSRGRSRVLAAMLCFAGAFLTKGPVALILPAAIIFTFLLIQREPFFRSARLLLAIFVPATLIGALWYLLAYRQGGEEFLSIVIAENFGRFFGNSVERELGHEHSAFYLYATLLTGTIPWSVLLLIDGASSSKRFLKQSPRELWRYLRANPLILFALLVVVEFLVFFSIPSSKRSVYLLPAYPFLAILLGIYLNNLSSRSAKAAYRFWMALVFSVLVLATIAGAWLCGVLDLTWTAKKPHKIAELNYFLALARSAFSGYLFLGFAFVVGAYGYCVRLSVREHGSSAIAHSIAFYISILLLVHLLILPPLAERLSDNRAVVALDLSRPEVKQLYYYQIDLYGVSFYSQKKVLDAEEVTDLEIGGVVGLAAKSREEFLSKFDKRYLLTAMPRTAPEFPEYYKELIFYRIEGKRAAEANPDAPV